MQMPTLKLILNSKASSSRRDSNGNDTARADGAAATTTRLYTCYSVGPNNPLTPEIKTDIEIRYKSPVPAALLGGAAADHETMRENARIAIPKCRTPGQRYN